jgi:hypothetical protein
MTTKTNAYQYLHALPTQRLNLPVSYRIYEKVRKIKRLFGFIDDFNWDMYTTHYRAELEWSSRFFTLDFSEVDFRWVDHRIYLPGDCKPLHLTHRCVWEAIGNLPDLKSVAEIGVGGGHFIAGFQNLLSKNVRLSGYDLSRNQLNLFKEVLPEAFKQINTGILDITDSSILETELPDCVYASTVLMHIQRPAAYKAALENFVSSGRKFAVLMDNWNSHDYVSDLVRLFASKPDLFGQAKLYLYDSGANIAVIISKGVELSEPYQPLLEASQLQKYMGESR